MIQRGWVDPNFEWEAVDPARQVEGGVAWSASEDELRARLAERQLAVRWIRPYDFGGWRRRAHEARAAAVEAFEGGRAHKFEFRNALWRELKSHLFELFDGKCAYCESAVLDVASGDVEHFRPKRKVTGEPSHPGYYWLAYDHENFLPCCERCNRLRGKRNHFPIAGVRTVGPGPHAGETPLLLNPLRDDPSEHLTYTDQGTVEGTTAQGRRSKDVYNLNRAPLVTNRLTDKADVEREFGAKILATGAVLAAWRQMYEELRRGKAERSAAKLTYFLRFTRELTGEAETAR